MSTIMLHFDCLKAKNQKSAPLIHEGRTRDICPYWIPTPQFPYRCGRPSHQDCPCNVTRKAFGGVALVE